MYKYEYVPGLYLVIYKKSPSPGEGWFDLYFVPGEEGDMLAKKLKKLNEEQQQDLLSDYDYEDF